MSDNDKMACNRRSFLKWTVAASALMSFPIHRGLRAKTQTTSQKKESVIPSQMEWRPVPCWHNCGGRCLNKVLLVDDQVIRQKTDDTTEDSTDFPQQRGCLRGRSQRHQVFGVDRLKYPMIRKHWRSGGGEKHLRGRDEWVRISWKEALDILAAETQRICQQYGNETLWVPGDGKEYQSVFAEYGGYVAEWGTESWGAWKETSECMGLADGYNIFGTNDRFDLRHSQLIVLWGANPTWSSPGNASYHYLQAKKAGAKFITIDPAYTDAAELLDAQWIPVNPATDHALALGIMYALLEQDDPIHNPLIDWSFLHRYTVGFDAEHMPQGIDPKENFKDYLLGTYTGDPKTPEWAASICGVAPSVICQLARDIGSTHRVALLTGWAPARIHDGEGWVQAFSTLGFMTGHMGKSGCMTGVSCHFAGGNNGTRIVVGGENGLPSWTNPITKSINHNEIPRALLQGVYRQRGEGDCPISIRMIFHSYNATLQNCVNIMQGIEAYRTNVEFIVTPAYVHNTCAKYSDLVLPITTAWERPGRILKPSNREVLLVGLAVTPPLHEAKSDQWIAKELAKRLGLQVKKLFPISELQQFFNTLQGATHLSQDGKTTQPLFTITEEDIKKWQVTGYMQSGEMALRDFLREGKYQVRRQADDVYRYIAYKDFIDDPENNPRPTQSGKFEIYCQEISKRAKECGWTEVAPIPRYTPKSRGFEASFADWHTQKKGDYPFQIYNPHYLRRAHSTLDNIPQLREAWPSPVYVNRSDAQRLDIEEGDTVILSGPLGKTLRYAKVTETLKPGVLALPHGSWVAIDESSGIDLAGADNVLTLQVPTGMGTSGWNTTLCNIEKWRGSPLKLDGLLPRNVIF